MNNEHTFPVVEIFGPTLQGEGYMAGQVTHFIRFGGCTYRCEWCDTMYAVDPEQVKANSTRITAQKIVWKLKDLPSPPISCVTLTGGDPCIHRHMLEVIDAIKTDINPDVDIIVETQGAVFQPWLVDCDFVTLSPKGPSSGMETNWKKLEDITGALQANQVPWTLKIVVFTEADFYYALNVRDHYPAAPMALQIGTPMEMPDTGNPDAQMIMLRSRLLNRTDEVFNYLASNEDFTKFFEPPAIRILPQIHTLIWGQERGK